MSPGALGLVPYNGARVESWPESRRRSHRDRRRRLGMLADDGTGEKGCSGARSRSTATSLRSSSTTARAAIGRSMTPRRGFGAGRRPSREASSPTSGSADDPICVAGAPFSVLDYDSVRRHARAIASAVQRRAMPPWLPEPGHGVFADERRLRDDQIALIAKWVESGAPEGNPADAPKPPTFSGGWQLGTPDLVLTLPEPYVLQPGTRDVFRNFVIPVPITATRYVRAVEFRADRPQVLHHADLAIDVGRVSRVLDRADPGPGFATMDGDQVRNVYGWSPGKVPMMEPADTAWTLEPGTDLVLLLHMIAGAKSETVQPTIGLFLSDTPPKRTPISVKLEAQGDRHSRRRARTTSWRTATCCRSTSRR